MMGSRCCPDSELISLKGGYSPPPINVSSSGPSRTEQASLCTPPLLALLCIVLVASQIPTQTEPGDMSSESGLGVV